MPSLEFGTRMLLRECWMNERVMVTIKTFVLHHLWGNGTPLQYSCLENPLDGGACWAAVHGVAKSQTRLSDFTVTFHFHALEEEMATRSSVLAWRIPGTGEPGGLPSVGSHRVRHDWSDLAAAVSESDFSQYYTTKFRNKFISETFYNYKKITLHNISMLIKNTAFY